MPNALVTPAPSPRATKTRRQGFYLQSRGESLFAWLHQPASPTTHGVVICPPIVYKQVHAHRSLRHLAEALANAGHAVCRLDYHGVGDSAGVDEDPDRLATWEQNIRDAISWMREVQGCRTISVVGLRLGGLLAMKAIEQIAIDELVLWSPVVKGRLFVREMQALGLTSLPADAGETSDIEAAGFVISEQTANELSKVDALSLQPRCRRALIVARDDIAEDRRLFEHLTKLGIETEQSRQPGFADMLLEPHKTKVPHEAIRFMAEWMSPESMSAPSAVAPLLASDMVSGHYRERIVQIPDPSLIGILTEPLTPPATERPLVVLVNGGAAYRIGPNRLYVLLARELARLGFRTLRTDLRGLGDSLAAEESLENDVYPETMFRDIDGILKHATTQLGANRIVLAGLCSGAYAAFQAGAQFANPALIECLLINPLTFFWKAGMSLDLPEVKEAAAFHYYIRSALRPEKWWKLISGNSKIGVMGAVRILGRRLRRRGPSEGNGERSTTPQGSDADVKHPAHDHAAGDIQRIAAAGRHLSLFFSADDPGYSLLMHRAKRIVKSLCKKGVIDITFIDRADHTFSRRQPRQAAIVAICKHLDQRY